MNADIKINKKVQQTLSVLKKYETMGKYYPIEVKNIMNRYILSLDS
jgi:hypothetical protein